MTTFLPQPYPLWAGGLPTDDELAVATDAELRLMAESRVRLVIGWVVDTLPEVGYVAEGWQPRPVVVEHGLLIGEYDAEPSQREAVISVLGRLIGARDHQSGELRSGA